MPGIGCVSTLIKYARMTPPLLLTQKCSLIKSKPLALVVDVGLLCRPAKLLRDMPPCAIQEAKRLVARRHCFLSSYAR